jgi:riboflavin kinase/FMN adenylyltransferase
MKHLHSIEEVHLSASHSAIGSFDGVHLGHQTLIRELVSDAHAAGLPAVVITFYPHPAVVLRRIQDAYYLTSPEERAELLGNLGVDWVITLNFDLAMAALSAQEFMQFVVQAVHLQRLLVGYDFALGRNRQGNIQVLEELGRDLGYTVRAVPPFSLNGEVVSSSRVRQLIQESDVATAAVYLDRYYDVRGPIVHGDSRGRQLGFPTANLEVPANRLLPASGVYATRFWLDGQSYDSVSNIGVRPTFENQMVERRVEAHVFDFDGDLYGRPVCLEFVQHLRPEMRFESIQLLVEQIGKDSAQAREVLRDAR